MKKICLIRHSEPTQLPEVSADQWPLSARGHEFAEAHFKRETMKNAVQVYASPLLRAVQTALHAELPLTVDSRLQERHPGREMPEQGDCWLRQYEDSAFKCPDGESFDEVGQRMNASVKDILAGLSEGESAIVVTHAAAMCAYLMRHCTIHVTDRASKTRGIIWQGKTIYTGNIPPLTGFLLSFRQGRLDNIEALT